MGTFMSGTPSCAFVDLYWRHVRLGQARFLLAHGCTQMQGYLFSPALAPDGTRALPDARLGPR